jgi:superfamily I DNA/RNA helicase
MTRPEILLGPPGTGKTTALLDIVDEELGRGCPPDRLGFVTFTRRGAETAVSRAAQRFGLERSVLKHFRTLHSLAYHALGLRSGDVVERKHLQEFADYAGVRVTGTWCEDGTFAGYEVGDRVLFMENIARMRGVPLRAQYDEDDDRLGWRQVDYVARCYAAFKEAHGLMDYTGMLQELLRQEAAPRLDVLLVDEAQDLSLLQWRVVWALAAGARRVVVAGDDDQAIYVWAGADVNSLIGLEGQVRVLQQSYRVPEVVQTLAAGVIGRVAHRRPKKWWCRPTRGDVSRLPDLADAELGGKDVLVLARNQYILREQVEPELRQRGIVFEQNGHSSVRPTVLSAVADWERLRAGEAVDHAAVLNIYAHMTSGVGVARGSKAKLQGAADDRTFNLAELRADFGLMRDQVWHEALDRLPPDEMSYMLAARRAGQKLLGTARVRISTIHGSKGGEADHVVLMTEMARRSFVEMRDHEDDEARVFYVGATRAREKLTVVGATTQQYYPHI